MEKSSQAAALSHLVSKSAKGTTPLVLLVGSELKKWLGGQRKAIGSWVASVGFKAEPGDVCLIASRDGALERVLVGVKKTLEPYSLAALPAKLPPGRYAIDKKLDANDATSAALGWALGTYRFTRYVDSKERFAQLVWPEACDRAEVRRLVQGISLGRDLINTPASDMGPEELAAAAAELAATHGAKCTVIKGKKLLEQNYPTIFTVGKGSSREPRLIDITWGKPNHPKLTLVGKGVCFDSGGLDLKSSPGMKLMKKDMGGAATVLGLAHVIMDRGLPVRLRVLIPAVENSVSGDSYRPLDIIKTRKGITVEVGNTDAEGRLVLCDALAEADTDKPDLLIDMATLTGAARVALGTDLPALFSNDDEVADAILDAGKEARDLLWRMPLHAPYRKQLDSPIADINNISSGSFGGAITAALYLAEFVSKSTKWVHIDTMAYNLEKRPGRPTGGDPLALRALSRMLERRYAAPS